MHLYKNFLLTLKKGFTRQVSSMILSARPTVANIAICFLLKVHGQTDVRHVRKQLSLTVGRPRGSKMSWPFIEILKPLP